MKVCLEVVVLPASPHPLSRHVDRDRPENSKIRGGFEKRSPKLKHTTKEVISSKLAMDPYLLIFLGAWGPLGSLRRPRANLKLPNPFYYFKTFLLSYLKKITFLFTRVIRYCSRIFTSCYYSFNS